MEIKIIGAYGQEDITHFKIEFTAPGRREDFKVRAAVLSPLLRNLSFRVDNDTIHEIINAASHEALGDQDTHTFFNLLQTLV